MQFPFHQIIIYYWQHIPIMVWHGLLYMRKNKVNKNFSCLLSLLFILIGSERTEAKIYPPPKELNRDSMSLVLEKTIRSGLNFLEENQIKETITGKKYAGEWPVYMVLQNGFFLLGGRKKVEDSNCFSVASTHNLLAKIYLLDSSYSTIPTMLDKAFPRILQFANGERFNFWNALPPNKKLMRGDTLFPYQSVRRPTQFKLRSRYINKAANVTEDADDTGLAYAAMMLQQKIKSKNSPAFTPKKPLGIAGLFDDYRDLDRKNRHWFNFINESVEDENSGAYLTWHGKEYEFKNWNIIKTAFHNFTFFLPFSECYPLAYRPYIPYGSNDIDAVVNANVIGTLSLCGEKNARGYTAAIDYLIKKCRDKKFDRIATYYPNRYQFAFAVANAYSLGAVELEPCKTILNTYLSGKQNSDGSWSSPWIINKCDKIQSTAYALNSLLLFNPNDLDPVRKEIEKGIGYLLQNCTTQNVCSHWEGGVMFSGGTVVRTSLFWKSDAYTTALVLHALVLYKKILHGE